MPESAFWEILLALPHRRHSLQCVKSHTTGPVREYEGINPMQRPGQMRGADWFRLTIDDVRVCACVGTPMRRAAKLIQ